MRVKIRRILEAENLIDEITVGTVYLTDEIVAHIEMDKDILVVSLDKTPATITTYNNGLFIYMKKLDWSLPLGQVVWER